MVYLGVIEEVCIFVLEKNLGLKFNQDFYVGYSLECINLGDKLYCVISILKIILGFIFEVVDFVDEVYNFIIEVGMYKVLSIKVVEVVKVIENM